MKNTHRVGLLGLLFLLCVQPVIPATPPESQAARYVDGDPWITSNARHAKNRWESLDVGRAAFGLQLSAANDLPFDRGTAGATFWVRQSSCANPFEGFGSRCGWQLGLAITQFRSLVVGGHAVEVDGLDGRPPYGRFFNSQFGSARITGMSTNTYADFSGVDVAERPSWIAGIDMAQDVYRIERRAGGDKVAPANFLQFVSIDRDGEVTLAHALKSERMEQTQAAHWATRAALRAGRLVFSFSHPYKAIPVCTATSETSSAVLRVHPRQDSCTVESTDGADTSMVDVIVAGNPD